MASYTGNPNAADAVIRSNSAASWAAMRAGANLAVISAGATTGGAYIDETVGAYYGDRLILPFNTAALGSGAVASAGTLDFYLNLIGSPVGGHTHYIDLVKVNLASAPSIATGDWSNIVIGTQCATRLSFAHGYTGAAQFVLNAAGLAAVNGGGYTTFALVMGNDYSDSQTSPTNLYDAGWYSYFNCNMSEASSNKPLLSLTYTPGATAGPVRTRRRPRGLYTR